MPLLPTISYYINHQAYLINRLPTISFQFAVPFSVFFHKNPDYHFLKTFGCSCFPLLRLYKSHKLDFKSEECLFLGYSHLHKGYKCLASSGHIFISKDVLFDEFILSCFLSLLILLKISISILYYSLTCHHPNLLFLLLWLLRFRFLLTEPPHSAQVSLWRLNLFLLLRQSWF